jgi:hypothetical protein
VKQHCKKVLTQWVNGQRGQFFWEI